MRLGLGALTVVLAAASGCARSELDICIDHLQNITEPRQPRDVVEARCVEAVRDNNGVSPF